MKKTENHKNFIQELKKHLKHLKKLKPSETHVISINASFGRYEIIIHPDRSNGHDSVEINGQVHHLFVTPKNMSAQPSKQQVRENLKNTIILKNLSIRLLDPLGDGSHLKNLGESNYGLHAEDCINLAGELGKELREKAEHSARFSLAAYKIVQSDILKAIKKERFKHNS